MKFGDVKCHRKMGISTLVGDFDRVRRVYFFAQCEEDGDSKDEQKINGSRAEWFE